MGRLMDDAMQTNLPGAALVLLLASPVSLGQGEIAKLVADDGNFQDQLGNAVALGGDWALVGAPLESDVNEAYGAVYAFQREPAGWVQRQKIRASDFTAGGLFGFAIDIWQETAVIGAWGDDGNGSGSAYVFALEGSVWVEIAKLTPSDGFGGQNFGRAVAIHEDTIVAGAWNDDENGPFTGAAYVFERADGGTWGPNETAKLLASNGSGEFHFGISVAVFGDVALIGTVGDSNGLDNSGSAYIFLRQPTGNWGPTENFKLTASDAMGGERLGTSCSLVGETAVVGAQWGSGAAPFSGAAYVFERTPSGAWGPHETAKLGPSDGAGGDQFGISVALSGDRALVGAKDQFTEGVRTGAAYVFERNAAGTWMTTESLKLLSSDGESQDAFGARVALHGERALVGAPLDDVPAGNAGSAYVFSLVLGSNYCAGDGSAGMCPCGNAGGVGQGCANTSGAGALLEAAGSQSVGADDLELSTSNLIPGRPALLFAGENLVNGGMGSPLGDGLRCAGGNAVRLGIRVPSATGDASWGPGLGAIGGWPAGAQRRFQVWYRDPPGSCGYGFNLSNGLVVEFSP